MGLFNKNQNQQGQPISQRQRLENRFTSAGMNILWVVLFTVINIALLLMNSNTYFLFSAFIPYALVDIGMFYCGKYPEEIYGDLSEYQFADASLLWILVGVAAVICALYLMCCLFFKKGSKGRVGWLIVALVFFGMDTVLMLLFGLGADSIIDVLFHGWIIVTLCMGIAAHFKLKKLPEEETVSAAEFIQTEEVATKEELPQE